MSTRCHILIYDSIDADPEDYIVAIYRHMDGYPESDHGDFGVVKDILEVAKMFKKAGKVGRKGIVDMDYFAARLVQYMCNEQDRIVENASETKNPDKVNGYGISKHIVLGVSYAYKVFPNKLEVFDVHPITEDEYISSPSDRDRVCIITRHKIMDISL